MSQRIFDAHEVHDEAPDDFPVPATKLSRAVLKRTTGWYVERDGMRAYLPLPGFYATIVQRRRYGSAEHAPDEFHAELKRDGDGPCERYHIELNKRGGVYASPRTAIEAIERYAAAAKRLPEGEVPTSVDVWGGSRRLEGSNDVRNVWHRVPARLLRKDEAVAAA